MTMDRSRLTLDSRQICIQMDQLANQSLAEADVTGVQAHALLYILHHSEMGTSVTALHQASGYSKATISNIIKRLREKLEGVSDQWRLKTVWGVGYKFEVAPANGAG